MLNDMKKRQYNFLVYRFFCLLLALHLVNLSIDVQDRTMPIGKTIANREDLSINKIESISEFLLEECFGVHDAVPEHDDPEKESELTELEQDYEFTQLFVFAPLRNPVRYLLMDHLTFRPAFISVHVLEILAPPPQPTASASVLA